MRNPSPPPLTDQEKESINADYIGDSLFSKKWVLGVLLQLYKHEQSIYVEVNSDNVQEENPEDSSELRLTQKFEDEMCEIWDISANADVAQFLFENQIKDIITDAVEKTQSPRLMEICFGIIGNLVCDRNICESFSADTSWPSVLLSYLIITDAMSLVELTRTVLVCVSNKHCLQQWLQNFEQHIAQLVYILQNSLNVDLLHHVSEILCILADTSDDIIETSLDERVLPAIKEAYSIVHKEGKRDCEVTLLQLLQLTSTVNKGVLALSEDENMLTFLFQCVPNRAKESVVSDRGIPFCSAVFSTFNCILSVKQVDAIQAVDSNAYVLEFLIDCLCKMDKVEKRTDIESYMGSVYFQILLDCLHDVLKVVSDTKDRKLNNIVDCIKRHKDCLENVCSGEFEEIGQRICSLRDKIVLEM